MNLKLWAAPRTRALRVVWLLEELALPYELIQVGFKPTSAQFFIQDTPTGKIPTLADGEVMLCESGAICQYLLARYGGGRLQPAPEEPAFGEFLQWLHFSESTAFAPLGVVVWLTGYRTDADAHPQLVADARTRAERTLAFVESHLSQHAYLAGDRFTAADVMMGFTLSAARLLGLLDAAPAAADYLDRILARPAAVAALARVNAAPGVS